jgi:hypothetical protein
VRECGRLSLLERSQVDCLPTTAFKTFRKLVRKLAWLKVRVVHATRTIVHVENAVTDDYDEFASKNFVLD